MKHLPHPAAAAALLAVAGSLLGAAPAWARAEGVPIRRAVPPATPHQAFGHAPAEPVRSRVTAHYVRSAAWPVLFRRGCRAGRRRESGVVVLAFGKQLYDGHSYGTLTFRGRFASDRTITRGLVAYAWGYARCVPHGSAASIWLARGTSNYSPSVPSSLRSGRRWARETSRLAAYLRLHGLDRRVRAAAAIDAEPHWEWSTHPTRWFLRGYRSSAGTNPVFVYRSKERGVPVLVQHRRRPPARLVSARAPRATPSYYVRSARSSVLRRRGCRAGRLRAFGIVILAFGKPSYDGHAYGALTFSGHFASNRTITDAMKAFARGYAGCLPRGSRSHIVLARGTSNYHLAVPSAYQAGRRWARETVGFARFLRAAGLKGRVRSAAAIDAEPAWNPSFRKTREFLRGYGAYRPGYSLYDFGSLDGGVGKVWGARQIWYVTAGMRYAHALPEIYYPEMARQWATMSRIAVHRFGRPIRFAGVMTQHSEACDCGYRPAKAHEALVRALSRHPATRVPRLPAVTNIRWAD